MNTDLEKLTYVVTDAAKKVHKLQQQRFVPDQLCMDNMRTLSSLVTHHNLVSTLYYSIVGALLTGVKPENLVKTLHHIHTSPKMALDNQEARIQVVCNMVVDKPYTMFVSNKYLESIYFHTLFAMKPDDHVKALDTLVLLVSENPEA